MNHDAEHESAALDQAKAAARSGRYDAPEPRVIYVPAGDVRVRLAVLEICGAPALLHDVVLSRETHRGAFSVTAPPYPLSSGQDALWRTAESIAGSGSVHLAELIHKLDAESLSAVIHALAFAGGVQVERAS